MALMCLRILGGDGARGVDWARGHHLCLTDTIFWGFFCLFFVCVCSMVV